MHRTISDRGRAVSAAPSENAGWPVSPRWIGLALLAAVAPICFSVQITHDAAWQMWIGRQMMHGADLYSDIIEINPPLWFWLAIPIAALADMLRVSSLDTLVAAFLLVTAAVLMLADRLLADWPNPRRMLFLIVFIIAALPFGNLAQREHFTFIAAGPYILLIGRRAAGLETPGRLAALVGAVAAVGFALKPHFALVPIMLELWLRRRPVRPETAVLLCGAALYGLCIFKLEPDYFTIAIPLAREAYGHFGKFSISIAMITVLPFVLAACLPRPADLRAGALLIASLTFYLVFVLQLKGFTYQAIPALGLLALALVASAKDLTKVQAVCAGAIAVLAVTPNLRPYRTPAWAEIPANSSFAALSVAPRAGWPLTEERKLKWPLRSMSLWMAPAKGDAIRAEVRHDLRCNPPLHILVDDGSGDFSRMFADVLAHYSTVSRNGSLTLMRLSIPMPPARNCRRIH